VTETAPAPDAAPDAAGRAAGGSATGFAAARRSKRSAAVSLVLVAGAGAAALTLGGLDPSQREEEALVYGTLGACIAQQLRGAEACIAAYTSAQETYAATAPRYETEADCQRHHGTGGCTPGAQVTEAARGRYLPVMAAFMMGRTDAQDLPVQPLYPHAPEEERAELAAEALEALAPLIPCFSRDNWLRPPTEGELLLEEASRVGMNAAQRDVTARIERGIENLMAERAE